MDCQTIDRQGALERPRHGAVHGAPPMAMLTVGTGAMIVGHNLIGNTAAAWWHGFCGLPEPLPGS